jgi:hypothetical protein
MATAAKRHFSATASLPVIAGNTHKIESGANWCRTTGTGTGIWVIEGTCRANFFFFVVTSLP